MMLMNSLYGSSTVIETLKRRVDSSVALAYFYFNFNDSKKLIYRNMLHSLIFQLCNRCPDPLRDLYKRTNDGSQQPTVDELLGTLKKTIGSYSQTYIVIDALDECISSELGEVLKFLAEVKTWNLKSLHILASSRPEQEIMEAVDSLHTCTVDLHDAHSRIKDDIRVYLDNVLETDSRLKKWGPTERVLIKETLSTRADGM